MRLYELLQSAKAELHSTKMELQRERSQAAAGGGGDRDAAVASMQALMVELRDKCRFTELQLAGAREENAKLAQATEEMRAQLAQSQASMTDLQRLNAKQTPMLHELQQAVERSARERAMTAEQLHEEQRRYEDTVHAKDQTVALLEQKNQALADELRRALDAQRAGAAQLEQINGRCAELERTNGELGKQLLSSKEQLKYLHLARRSEAQVQSLLQQLQMDNARLVKLLASTDEYREFVAYAEDAGGLTYVPPLAAGNASYGTSSRGAGGSRDGADALMRLMPARERGVKGAGAETDYWVPSDTYALANDFRRTHVPTLPMELFAELLLRLNRVWRAREQKRLERQREKLQKRIGELRRRVAQSVPYEEVLQSSEMERLRRELKEMRAAFNAGRRKLNETEERLLESSLESAIAIDAQLQQAKGQNEHLLHEVAEHELRFRSAFGHGASAAAAAATEVSDRFAERVTELMREFQRKMLHMNRADADLYTQVLQAQSWFLEALDRRIVQSREKMGSVYDTVLAANPSRPKPTPAVSSSSVAAGGSAITPSRSGLGGGVGVAAGGGGAVISLSPPFDASAGGDAGGGDESDDFDDDEE